MRRVMDDGSGPNVVGCKALDTGTRKLFRASAWTRSVEAAPTAPNLCESEANELEVHLANLRRALRAEPPGRHAATLRDREHLAERAQRRLHARVLSASVAEIGGAELRE